MHVYLYIYSILLSFVCMIFEASYILFNDELVKDIEEGKITFVDQKDILTLALGTQEHLGQVKEKGGKQKPQTILQHTKVVKSS